MKFRGYQWILYAGLLGAGIGVSSIPEARAESFPIRVITFNIRYDNVRDGINSWPLRAHLVAGVVRLYDPDIFGVQEAYLHQVGAIHDRVPGYRSFGAGRDKGAGERCTIFFRDDVFELLHEQTFWLSETPERASRSWGSSLPRIVTWGEFRHKGTEERIFVFNTHFDHESAAARTESAKLVIRKAEEIAGASPCVLMGDFNCGEDSEPYRILSGTFGNARYLSRTGHTGPSGTFTGFDAAAGAGNLIDFIFVKGDIRVDQHATLSDTWNGRVPSDHRPLLADITIGEKPDQNYVEMHEDWRFHTDPDVRGISLGYHQPEFDDSTWNLVNVGRPWEEQGFTNYDGVGYFRKSVLVPESWQDQERILLETGGVDDSFKLFINGFTIAQVGSQEDIYWNRPAVVQLPRGVFRYGQENSIVLAVKDFAGGGGLVGWPVRLTIEPLPVTHSAFQIQQKTIVAEQGFQVNAPDRRALIFPFTVPPDARPPAWFSYGIGNSSDDTGDCGLHARVECEPGGVLKSEFLKADSVQWREVRIEPGCNCRFIIEDLDTRLDGPHPGNGGTVRAFLKFESALDSYRESGRN